MRGRLSLFALCATLARAGPLNRRVVDQLDEAAFEEAQRRDDTATRALSNVQIKTSDGKCLFVDELSGDFRANLTPIQIADCGSTDGQGWDVITSGVHNDQDGQALIVSTLTQACFNFDPRRAAGSQVNLFSCGGRADGDGQVTNSQLFAFDGSSGPLSLVPGNGEGQQCLTASGDVVDVAACDDGAAEQSFTFGDAAGGSGGDDAGNGGVETPGASTTAGAFSTTAAEASATTAAGVSTTESPCTSITRTVMQTITVTSSSASEEAVASTSDEAAASTSDQAETSTSEQSATSVDVQTTSAPAGDIPTALPTTPVPVSRAGGTLNPELAAEAHQFDSTATRPVQSVNIRAPDGRCLSIDPTAGDFRENLIPVALAECNETPNQKWDVVTAGVHNDGKAGEALLVNVLTDGCISFDGRRAEGDTVTLFSCGGRAAGEGKTDVAQLYPFDGTNNIVLEPASGNGATCLVAGDERLDSTACTNDDTQVFELVDVL